MLNLNVLMLRTWSCLQSIYLFSSNQFKQIEFTSLGDETLIFWIPMSFSLNDREIEAGII